MLRLSISFVSLLALAAGCSGFNGLRADDDGCPGAWGCKAAEDGGLDGTSDLRSRSGAPVDASPVAPPERCMGARCQLGGVDPWSAEELAKHGPPADVIVGSNDLTNPDFSCHTFATGVTAQADTVVRYVKGDEPSKICTGLLITKDDKVLVPSECKSNDPTKPSKAIFGVYPSVFGCATVGTPLAGDEYPVTAEALSVDLSIGFMVSQLGLNALGDRPTANHFSVRFNSPSKWPLTGSANLVDELIYGGTQRIYTLVDDACQMTVPFSGGIGTTDCDSEAIRVNGSPATPGVALPERGTGGLVVWDFNGCVEQQVPGGVICAPGTGPQSPGAYPGRLVGVQYLVNLSVPGNRIVSLARLTNATGILTPYLTPGNFTI